MARDVAPGLAHERALWRSGFEVVAGHAEVGRGAWAGPLTVGAVVLPPAGTVLTFMRIMQPACDVVLCALHELASSPIDR